MMTFNQILFIVFAIIIVIFSTSNSLVVKAKNVGISIDLVHRDSPKSPFYNSSLTSSQRVAAALRRSLEWYYGAPKYGSTNIIPDHGEFLMKISFGTPPVEKLLIVDTGSDLTWIECEPCTDCFKKNAIFDPNHSETYAAIPCTARLCHFLNDTSCNGAGNTCQYSIWYRDKSFSHGDLVTETLTLVSSEVHLIFPSTYFGCGHKNKFGVVGDKSSGIVGLGGGPESLISQWSSSIGGTFSYCLVPMTSKKSGKLYVGESDEFSSTVGAVSTPLVPTYPSTFYYVTLTGISVGSERIVIPEPPPRGSELPQVGNMIIDSGTTLTKLRLYVYNQFISAVKRYVKLSPVDDPHHILSLCYNTTKEAYFPIITMHFEGADLKLNPSNTFIRLGSITCSSFSPSKSNHSVLGNLAQVNLFVSYDLVKQMVSFKPTDCEKV